MAITIPNRDITSIPNHFHSFSSKSNYPLKKAVSNLHLRQPIFCNYSYFLSFLAPILSSICPQMSGSSEVKPIAPFSKDLRYISSSLLSL